MRTGVAPAIPGADEARDQSVCVHRRTFPAAASFESLNFSAADANTESTVAKVPRFGKEAVTVANNLILVEFE